MKYLLDTHTFLWFSAGSPELSEKARSLITDKNHEIYVSIASLWEISIKTALGKLTILDGYEGVIDDIIENEMEILPINFAHTVAQNKLLFHHRDPFDRILVSQALVESMDLIGKDEVFDAYFSITPHRRIW